MGPLPGILKQLARFSSSQWFSPQLLTSCWQKVPLVPCHMDSFTHQSKSQQATVSKTDLVVVLSLFLHSLEASYKVQPTAKGLTQGYDYQAVETIEYLSDYPPLNQPLIEKDRAGLDQSSSSQPWHQIQVPLSLSCHTVEGRGRRQKGAGKTDIAFTVPIHRCAHLHFSREPPVAAVQYCLLMPLRSSAPYSLRHLIPLCLPSVMSYLFLVSGSL